MNTSRITRRAVLLAATAGACARFRTPRPTAPFLWAPPSQPVSGARAASPKRVAIIGGGVAGLAAANVLATANVEVVMFEARDRLGGRVHTHVTNGAQLELGAGWIHDPEGNWVAAMADLLWLERRAMPIERLITDGTLFEPGHGFLRLTERLSLLGALSSVDELCVPREGQSAREVLDAALKAIDANELVRARAEAIVDVAVSTMWGAPLSALSSSVYGAPYLSQSGDDVVRPGYRKVFEAITPSVELRLGTVVSAIRQRGDVVHVETASGERVDCSDAIVTVPLGVLKARAVTFEPELDAERLATIDAAGWAAFEKTFMVFPEKFWGDIGSAVLQRTSRAPFAPMLIDWSIPAGRPTLAVLSAGAAAQAFHALRDEERSAQLMALVREIFPSAPAPLTTIATQWSRDPYARGAYYFPGHLRPATEVEVLAAPHGKIRFAGEATVRGRHSTVDGAMQSGVREARALLGDERAPLTLRPVA